MKKIALLLLFLFSFATVGCSLFDSRENKLSKWNEFYLQYMSIYNSVQKDAERMNEGYEDVQKNKKYAVDFHNELKEIEKDLRKQQAIADKIITPNGYDHQYLSFLMTGIDNYIMAITAYNSIPYNPDVRNILIFEQQLKKGDNMVKSSKEFTDSVAKDFK